MPKSEDGEFELILGNRQLLSVFFIVVILFGVFFTMGYIVGRNSAPAGSDIATVRKESKPLVVDSSDRAPEQTSNRATPPNGAPSETAQQTPPVVVTPPKASAEKSTLPAESRRAEKTPAPAATGSREPSAGETYLQLAATSKREADIMVDVLRQKSFKAMAAEIPEKLGTFRVLVGPVTDATANKMRADLQGAGFPGNAAIRRAF